MVVPGLKYLIQGLFHREALRALMRYRSQHSDAEAWLLRTISVGMRCD
jgi:hypothetical protein